MNDFEFINSNIRPKTQYLVPNFSQKILVSSKESCRFSHACHEPANQENGSEYCNEYYVVIVWTCLSL